MKINLQNIIYVSLTLLTVAGIYVRNQYPEATNIFMVKTVDSITSYAQARHVYLQTRDLTHEQQLTKLQQYLIKQDYDAVSQVKAALIFNLVNYFCFPPAFAINYAAGVSDAYQGDLLLKNAQPTYSTFYVQSIKYLQQALQALKIDWSPEEYLEFKVALEPLREFILGKILYQKQYLSTEELKATL